MSKNTIDFIIASNEIAVATDYQSGDIIGATKDKEQLSRMVQDHYCLDESPLFNYRTNNNDNDDDVLVYSGISDGYHIGINVKIELFPMY